MLGDTHAAANAERAGMHAMTTSMNVRIWDKYLTERDKAVFVAG
jgi:hypothetical protein